MHDPDSAPNYSGDYPNAGQYIGPAWRAAWRLLADGTWHSKAELLDVMVPAGPIVAITATNLLRAARRAKVLESRIRKHANGGYAPSDYRIAR